MPPARTLPHRQPIRALFVFWLGLLFSFAAIAADPSEPIVAAGDDLPIPSDADLEASHAVFGDITIDNKDVFDQSDPKDNKALFRLADKIHVNTRPSVIRHQLLFRSGDAYSRHAMDESARLLRTDRYFYDASVVPIRYHDGKVDVLVTTRDVWTLDPGINFGRSGGANSSSVSLQELNFLGTGGAIGIGHDEGVDRSETSASFSNTHVFGTWTQLNLFYADRSDGSMRFANINSPFYSLETRYAAGVLGQDNDQVDHLYDRSNIIDQFHDHSVFAQAYAGWSTGLHNSYVSRWTVGFTDDERRFSPDMSWTGPTLSPPDHKFLYPWIRYDLLQDYYVRLVNHDQIGRTEDFYLGTNLTAKLGWADSSWGSTHSVLLFQLAAGRGAMLTNTQTLTFTSVFTGRLENGTLDNGVVDAAIKYYLQQSNRWLFFSSLRGTGAHKLDLENQILLGGDNGLRGYPLRYQDGTSRALATVEERYFTNWFPFRLVRLGAAVFADAGRTWGNQPLAQPSLGILEDVGVGLRFGMARSGFGNVIHVDVAFPLNTRPGVDAAQFLIQTQASF
jgi:hypothetical protein